MKMLRNKSRLNEYELENNRASYMSVIGLYISDLVLMNTLPMLDMSVWDNMENFDFEDEGLEIFQWFVCHIGEYERKRLLECKDIVLSYSNMLECDVLCVTHYGTSWDYVLTDVELTDDINELY